MTRLRPAVIVHYHEIGLKRGNRPLFLRHLARNLARATSDLAPVGLRQLSGRILLDLDAHPAPERVRERALRVCGVASAALAYRVPSTLDAMKAVVGRLIEGRAFASFRISARRAFKTYPMMSVELNRALGAFVPQRVPARVVVYRRLMVRIAEALAREHGALALATGESLGQVASQTLENIARIDEAAGLPILRPLIGMDKLEITREARRLDTFEISIEPDQDWCTLFVPAHPATRMSEDEAC